MHSCHITNSSFPPLTRELTYAEFPLVKEVWYQYHPQEANLDEDRIFGTFIDGTLAAVARCRLHKDGHEVDGFFTLEKFRGCGLARLMVQALIYACGHEVLFMHSTLQLHQFLQDIWFCADLRGPVTADDKGPDPLLLRRNGGVQTVCPMRGEATPRSRRKITFPGTGMSIPAIYND
jgi:GNAT superfamily N-acetyltransferase